LLQDQSQESLDFETFQKTFGCSLLETPLQTNSSLKPQNPMINFVKPLESLRMKLKTCNKDFETELLKHDPNKSGLISSLELRNLFKDLKLGLNSNEIIEVISLFQSKEKAGFFEYPRFLRLLQKTPLEQTIAKRTKSRLEHLRGLIEDYLISAKNAFRQFNEQNSGRMSFEEFEKLTKSLYLRNEEEPQAFDILKDLFDFIDLRKDGVLDIHEWMQTFRGLEKEKILGKDIRNEQKGKVFERNLSERREKSLHITEKKENAMEKGNVLEKSAINFSKTMNNFEINEIIEKKMNKTPRQLESTRKIEAKSPLQYQDSQEYDDLIELIVRNRRLLQDLMEKEGTDGKITSQQALEIIRKTLKIESIPDQILRDLLRFSQKEENLVHIRFFMEVLKDRAKAWTSPPRNFRKREGSLSKSGNAGFKTISEKIK